MEGAAAAGVADNDLPPLQAILNLHDIEAVAQRAMVRGGKQHAWDYYSSGAEDELTYRENVCAFQRIWLNDHERLAGELGRTGTFLFLFGDAALGMEQFLGLAVNLGFEGAHRGFLEHWARGGDKDEAFWHGLVRARNQLNAGAKALQRASTLNAASMRDGCDDPVALQYDILTAGDNGCVYLWRESECIAASFALPEGKAITTMKLHDDGERLNFLLVGGQDGAVAILHPVTLEILATLSVTGQPLASGSGPVSTRTERRAAKVALARKPFERPNSDSASRAAGTRRRMVPDSAATPRAPRAPAARAPPSAAAGCRRASPT